MTETEPSRDRIELRIEALAISALNFSRLDGALDALRLIIRAAVVEGEAYGLKRAVDEIKAVAAMRDAVDVASCGAPKLED